MSRSSRVLVSAFITTFVLVASSASAAQIEVEGGGETAISAAQAEGKHVLTVEGNKVECNTANFEAVGGTVNGASEFTVHPVYTGCSAFGFLEATVTTTGCNYTLGAPGTEEAGMKFTMFVVLDCNGGSIAIAAGNCAMVAAGQTITEGVVLENTTVTPMDVMVTMANAPVKATKTKDGFLCPFNGTGAVTASYSGGTTVNGNTHGITVQ